MEMEITCLTRTGPGIKNCSVYMVYLQEISHQFEINVINAFYNNFWNHFGKFFKRSRFFSFWHLKKRRLYVFNLLSFSDQCLLLFRFITFPMIMVHVYCSWNIWWFVQVSAIFQRLFSCFFVVPTSHTRKVRNTHTHTHTHTLSCFSLKNHGQTFFLNHLFLQFNSRINCGFYFCK